MLLKPEAGIGLRHVKLEAMCDWIEASMLFEQDGEATIIDIVDILVDEHVYSKQDDANAMIQNAWVELKRRNAHLGTGSPFEFTSSRIKNVAQWNEYPVYTFCLLASLALWYPGWVKKIGGSYLEQGEIFEEITKESLQAQFPTWTMEVTGWSRGNPTKLQGIVDKVAKQLGEKKGEVEIWTSPYANEAGLDILCYKSFNDARNGIPVYLIQCASGANWRDKFHTPELKVWTKVIQFAATPTKGFSVPFAVLDREFSQSCNLIDGMLLDRIRLMSPTLNANESWVSASLKSRIIAWATPRIDLLEFY